MKPHPANARRHQAKRIAMRAALAGQRLDPHQLKIVIAEWNALLTKSSALSAQADKAVASAQIGMPDRVFTVAERRLDQLHAQDQTVMDRWRKLGAHPQVAAVLAKEERSR